jgi:signal transduction histidine kinase
VTTPEISKINSQVWGDKSVVTHQIFSNLLSNAIKFSEKGSAIEIVVTEFTNTIRFEFKDFGLGIPNEKINNIFKIDHATSTVGTSGEKGTGYGMPLVHVFTEKLGGSIDIRSRHVDEFPENHGTIMIVELPKAKETLALTV